jgi:hypothetical protein
VAGRSLNRHPPDPGPGAPAAESATLEHSQPALEQVQQQAAEEMSEYLYVFGYEFPAQRLSNQKYGWDDEDSFSLFIHCGREY